MGEEKNRTPGYFRIFCFCAIYCALFSTVKNIAYFKRITLELRDVSQSGFTRLKEKCVEISSILIPMDIPDSCSYENRAIDVLSQEIVPQELEDRIVLKITGDRNCCYRAISLLLCRELENGLGFVSKFPASNHKFHVKLF